MKRRLTGHTPRLPRIFLVIGACLLGSLLLGALPSRVEAQAQASRRDELAAKVAGKRITRDASTGQLRAITTDEAKAVIDAVLKATERDSLSAAAPVQSGFGQALQLGDQTGQIVLARWNDDGSVSTRCVESADEAVAFLTGEGLPTE